MTFRGFIVTMFFATAICWVGFGSVIMYINPDTASVVGLVLFYASLFLSVVGTCSLVGVVLRSRFFQDEMQFIRVRVAFRQATWLGMLVVGWLLLLRGELFNIWTAIFFVISLTVLEAIVASVFSRR